MARIRAVQVSLELLQEIMTKGWTVGDNGTITCTEGLPEGAVFVGSRYDPNENYVALEFTHESFPELALGEPAPTMEVVFAQEVMIPLRDDA